MFKFSKIKTKEKEGGNQAGRERRKRDSEKGRVGESTKQRKTLLHLGLHVKRWI